MGSTLAGDWFGRISPIRMLFAFVCTRSMGKSGFNSRKILYCYTPPPPPCMESKLKPAWIHNECRATMICCHVVGIDNESSFTKF